MSLQASERCGDDIRILQKEITEVKLLLSLAFTTITEVTRSVRVQHQFNSA